MIIYSNKTSTSTSTGALVVYGGVGIGGKITVNQLEFSNSIPNQIPLSGVTNASNYIVCDNDTMESQILLNHNSFNFGSVTIVFVTVKATYIDIVSSSILTFGSFLNIPPTGTIYTTIVLSSSTNDYTCIATISSSSILTIYLPVAITGKLLIHDHTFTYSSIS